MRSRGRCSLSWANRREAWAPEALGELLTAIRKARFPTMLLGHGVKRSLESNAVVEFAREAGIPVATTMSARADFPNDDPLYIGMVGAAGHPSAHDLIRRQTDLLIVVGAGFNMMTRQPLAGFPGEKIAAVNVDLGEIDRAVRPRFRVRGDAGEVFAALRELLRVQPFRAPAVEGYEVSCYRPRLVKLGKRSRDPGCESDDLLQSSAIAE